MAVSRAQSLAEVLWELKKADKLATYSAVAKRAGFSAGANGRTVLTAMKVVMRDWSHLQWWRAVKENGLIDKGSVHAEKLEEVGYTLKDAKDAKGDKNVVAIVDFEDHAMVWEEEKKVEPFQSSDGDAGGEEEEE
jgi:alkylated DNA nucleotide flippase Atl1